MLPIRDPRFWMPLLLAASSLCSIPTANAQNARECSSNTMQLCRNNIDDVVLGYGNTRKMDLEDQCWRVRQNFDCVLWQTSMCLKQTEQENNSDSIMKAWRFLEVYCDKFKNWWTKPCYSTENMKRCENNLTSRSRSVDKAACKGYVSFRQCAMTAIENDCSNDDQRLLGVYLMEKGQQKAWKCPRDDTNYSDEPINAPLASRDIMYSDSSYSTCVYNAAKQVQTCLTDFETIQKMARAQLSEDSKKEKTCCGVKKYGDCVLKAMSDSCGTDGSKEANNVIHSLKSRIYYNCDEFDEEVCSSAMSLSATVYYLVALLLSTFALNFV